MTSRSLGDHSHDTAVVVAHEIYGVNDHIIGVARMLRPYRCDVLTPSFLPLGLVHPREDERQAYRKLMPAPGVMSMSQALVQFPVVPITPPSTAIRRAL
ncbi:hypothetical protein [Streptomyces cinnamoneus]|nr:hypothetical protein [Streptomyces cinnamoneus]